MGGYSTAFGYKTLAIGGYSTAFGVGTVADQINQLVIGSYNKKDIRDNIFIVGNGSDDGHRKNALEVSSSGDLKISGSLTQSSDVRLKKDIRKIENPLDKIQQINGVTFNWKDSENQNREMGVIAQDVQKVAPELVEEDAEGYLSVSYSNMMGLLIEAIKELKKENDNLKKALNSAEIQVK